MKSQVITVEPATPIKQAVWMKKKTSRGTKTKMAQLTPEKRKKRIKSPVRSPIKNLTISAIEEEFVGFAETPEPFRLPKKVFHGDSNCSQNMK